jgi:hypothetical protein
MIPLQTGAGPPPPPAPKLAGGPEDVFSFLYWLMQKPIGEMPRKKRRLSKNQQKMLRLLRSLDAARLLQLARANAGIFTSA